LVRIDPKNAGEVVSTLAEGLKSSEAPVRMKSAEALGRIGPDAKAALPQLTRLLKDNDVEVRAAADRAIEQIKAAH
jgi:HEAT repeat protein